MCRGMCICYNAINSRVHTRHVSRAAAALTQWHQVLEAVLAPSTSAPTPTLPWRGPALPLPSQPPQVRALAASPASAPPAAPAERLSQPQARQAGPLAAEACGPLSCQPPLWPQGSGEPQSCMSAAGRGRPGWRWQWISWLDAHAAQAPQSSTPPQPPPVSAPPVIAATQAARPPGPHRRGRLTSSAYPRRWRVFSTRRVKRSPPKSGS